ncbi:MAG: hypothetical protein H6823_23980 [Planctomycetaceae bacterium]|nr:hypothetical protein [Planctomycetaceae bacterium]
MHRRATIGTLDAVPIGQRNVGTAGVVSSQEVSDDHEEVEQTTLLLRPANWLPTFSFADRFILNMRMRHTVVRRRRMCVDCDHSIIVGVPAD